AARLAVSNDSGLMHVAAAQQAAEAAAMGEFERAGFERKVDLLADLGHALDQRRGPGRRQHIDSGVGMQLLQRRKQALCHHHVAHPAWADHEDRWAFSHST
ncbi:MAG: hypothetical protein EOQ97_24270, partial [Mesorhizobium sp.]